MDVHYLRHGSDTTAACGQPVLDTPPDVVFCTRHDQATCGGCKAASL